MGEHTELPWAAMRSNPNEGVDGWWIYAQPHTETRGFSREVGWVNGGDENKANADLIVKAVNAHEAMKSALKNAVSLIDEDIIRVRPSDRKQLLAEWNAALSLAEGVE